MSGRTRYIRRVRSVGRLARGRRWQRSGAWIHTKGGRYSWELLAKARCWSCGGSATFRSHDACHSALHAKLVGRQP